METKLSWRMAHACALRFKHDCFTAKPAHTATLDGAVNHIKSRRPLMFVLENVHGLKPRS